MSHSGHYVNWYSIKLLIATSNERFFLENTKWSKMKQTTIMSASQIKSWGTKIGGVKWNHTINPPIISLYVMLNMVNQYPIPVSITTRPDWLIIVQNLKSQLEDPPSGTMAKLGGVTNVSFFNIFQDCSHKRKLSKFKHLHSNNVCLTQKPTATICWPLIIAGLKLDILDSKLWTF